MDLILIIFVLFVIFCGGFGLYGQRTGYGGPGLNVLWVLIVVVLLFAVLQYGGLHRFY